MRVENTRLRIRLATPQPKRPARYRVRVCPTCATKVRKLTEVRFWCPRCAKGVRV